MIAKPGNKTATSSWSDPYTIFDTHKCHALIFIWISRRTKTCKYRGDWFCCHVCIICSLGVVMALAAWSRWQQNLKKDWLAEKDFFLLLTILGLKKWPTFCCRQHQAIAFTNVDKDPWHIVVRQSHNGICPEIVLLHKLIKITVWGYLKYNRASISDKYH